MNDKRRNVPRPHRLRDRRLLPAPGDEV